MSAAPLLEVKNLSVTFSTPQGLLRAVDGVSFSLDRQEALGIVGESGSGKSVTALSILRLFGPLARVSFSGEVRFEGIDLLDLPEAELRQVRGAKIGMIFQDPLTSLNPLLPVGEQVAETLRFHLGFARARARSRAAELLSLVGIPDPLQRLDDPPHRFSGGMRQRIMIAIAIACEPKLLIADEPTTALDVTVQAQVLLLLDRLRREMGMSLILISHDFGVVAATCDSVQVMYGGRLIERGKVEQILESPNHPYTAALMRSVPRLDETVAARLKAIPGQPLTVFGCFRGCRFAPRCDYAIDRCRAEDPPPFSLAPGHWSACWLARERAGEPAPPGSRTM